MTCGQRRALRHRSNEGSHYLEREGEILYTLYTKWRVLYIHEAYSLNMFYAQKHGLVEAGKRGSRQHSTQGR